MSVASSEAVESSTEPLLRLTVDLSLGHPAEYAAILWVGGELFTAGGRFLAPLFEELRQNPASPISARIPGGTLPSPANHHYLVQLLAPLSQGALDAIELEREADKKHDVVLKLRLHYVGLVSNALVSDIRLMEIKNPPSSPLAKEILDNIPSHLRNGVYLPLYYASPPQYPNNVDAWLLSGDNGPTFLNVERSIVELNHRIPSSDWINEYKSKLGLGRYITVEMPLPSDGSEEGRCHEYLKRARKAYDIWDLKSVFANCRDLVKCLDDLVKERLGGESFTYKERWGRASQRFAQGHPNWASFPLHEEDMRKNYREGEFRVGRADAEAILLSAEVLFKYAMDLLREAD
jgi:hypothetical protein